MTKFNSKAELIEAAAQKAAADWNADRGNADGSPADLRIERRVAADRAYWVHPGHAAALGKPGGWHVDGVGYCPA